MFQGIVFTLPITHIEDGSIRTISPSGYICDLRYEFLETCLFFPYISYLPSINNPGIIIHKKFQKTIFVRLKGQNKPLPLPGVERRELILP